MDLNASLKSNYYSFDTRYGYLVEGLENFKSAKGPKSFEAWQLKLAMFQYIEYYANHKLVKNGAMTKWTYCNQI